MPKFVIERQYLVPMYQHIVVEAETLEAACEMAVSDDISWDSQEMDCDNARATTLTAAKAIPDGYEVDPAQHVLIAGTDPIGIESRLLSLRERGRDRSGCSKSPPNSPTTNEPPAASSAAAEGARGVGAVRPSRSCREQEQTCGPQRGLCRSSVTREGLRLQAEFNPAPLPPARPLTLTSSSL